MDFLKLFEEKIANYTKFKYAVTVDCCTNGIILALAAKKYFNEFHDDVLTLTKYTYLSIPMTLKNYGYKIQFINDKWTKFYEIGNTEIYDAATDFHENMVEDYSNSSIACVSFQQKKRLSLGRGGVILFNDVKYLDMLKRLRYDGRDPYQSDKLEIQNNKSNIICGFHCYMEPDKAAVGIVKLNQSTLLPQYTIHSYKDYYDLSQLDIFK